MRQVYALLGLAKKWGRDRGRRRLRPRPGAEAVSVGVDRADARARRRPATAVQPPPPGTAASSDRPGHGPGAVTRLAGRFARDPQAFATRRPGADPPMSPAAGSGPVTVGPELKALLRRVKLGRAWTPCPSGSPWPAAGHLGHAEFLELVLADEVTRRDSTRAALRARAAGLDPAMRLDDLGPHRQGDLRPRHLARAVLAAVPRRRPQRRHPGAGRGRQDVPGHRPRAHRGPPPLHASPSPAATAAQTAAWPAAGQQPRRRDAQAAARGPAHHRRLRAAADGRPRHRRHLRADRGTTPEPRPPS